MPGFNVWAPRVSPFGNQLSGVIYHPNKALLDRYQSAVRSNYRSSSELYKEPGDDIMQPSKRAKVEEMPATRKRTRTPSRPRTFKRRRSRYGRRYARRRIPMLWPRQQLVKFRAVHADTSSAAAGTACGLILINANSLNDPFNTPGDELPLGLDQWAAMYGKYVVVSSTLSVAVHVSTATGSILCGITLRPDGTSLTNSEYYMEIPMTQATMLTTDMDHKGLQMTYKGKKYEKISKWRDAEDFQATFSATPGSPTVNRYFHLWFQDTDQNGGHNTVIDYVATVEYTVLLFDSIVPARSSMT